jgi:hypothetical protein
MISGNSDPAGREPTQEPAEEPGGGDDNRTPGDFGKGSYDQSLGGNKKPAAAGHEGTSRRGDLTGEE